MKKFIASVCVVAFAFLFADSTLAQISLPIPSPHGMVSQDVGLTEVSVDYYRPKRNNRAIFGDGPDFLVPFGQVWRTGANAGSVVTFSDAVSFRDSELEAGSYLLLTRPGKDSWDIIFYKDVSLGGNVGQMKTEEIALETSVTPGKLGETVETFTLNIADISEDNKRAALEISWENTVVRIGFEVDYDSKVMAMIEQNTQVDPGNLMAAANYYLQTNRNLEQALEWANAYLANNSGEFWNVHVKAQILAALGRTDEAITVAKESIKLAKNNSGGDFGFVQRNEALIAELEK